MDVNEVRERVETIRQAAGDPEGAHGLEDHLHTDVLRFIASGEWVDPYDPDPFAVRLVQDLAAEALKTVNVKFSRWYA